MRQWIRSVCVLAGEWWSWVLVSLVLMFLFPEPYAPTMALFALFFAWMEVRTTHGRWPIGDAGKWIWLFLAFMAASIAYSPTTESTERIVHVWLVTFGYYLALTGVITSPERFRRLLQVLTLVVGILGTIACVQYFGACLEGKIIRVQSEYTNPNIFAETMVCLLPFALYGAITSRRWLTKFIYLFCLLTGVAGMAFAFSRASYFCLIVMGCVFILFNIPRLKHARGWLLLVTLLIIVLLTVPNVFTDRLATLNLREHSVAERVQIWQATLPAIAEHPLGGLGAGTQTTSDLMIASGLPTVPHAHNLYMQLLLEGGTLALTSFMIVIVRMLRPHSTLSKAKNPQGYQFSVAFIAAMTGFLLFGWVDYPLFTRKLISLFWILLALSDLSASFYLDQPLTTWFGKKRSDKHA